MLCKVFFFFFLGGGGVTKIKVEYFFNLLITNTVCFVEKVKWKVQTTK